MGLIGKIRVFIAVSLTCRSCLPFLYKTNLQSLHPFSIAQASGLFSISCPIQPAITFYMCTVVNIILISQRTGQTDLNGFQSFPLACGSSLCAVFHPVHPAIALGMNTVLDSSRLLRFFRSHLCCVQPCCSWIRSFYRCFRCSLFRHFNLQLNRFQSFPFSGCTDDSTVFCPVVPAAALNMDTIGKLRNLLFLWLILFISLSGFLTSSFRTCLFSCSRILCYCISGICHLCRRILRFVAFCFFSFTLICSRICLFLFISSFRFCFLQTRFPRNAAIFRLIL